MGAFVLRIAINAAALYVAAWVVPRLLGPGTIRLEGLETVLVVALIFGLVNALIRPLVLAFTCLLNLVTLGLFTLVVNALMLWLTSWVVEWLNRNQGLELAFAVEGFAPAFLGALIISLASFFLTRLIH